MNISELDKILGKTGGWTISWRNAMSNNDHEKLFKKE